ncbi:MULTISPECIES: organic hydroperoxide resistance protein [unclassified Streptomyces]|uniref:organic hydroperoxide resistance protein n=1 Tax=unclassified Streptomyces TaxID=2593676 RepID=UPI00101E35BD|nr:MULTISPECIES: organic hydroperoxide resistance protein [unclassified Streptomyces]MBZ9637836.1 organic hydroperoxide resistance protein [Streptomyces sp. PSKA30]RZB13317.1 organic hydroperoxide resistance protein [Streptomyces sp. F001]
MPNSYTAVVNVTGEGRNGGRVQSDDRLLETTLSYPKELGGSGTATNPEQLFAAGWGACFLGAVRRAAADRKVRLTSTEINAEISLNHNDGGYSLAAVLNLELGGVDQDQATELADAAHQLCPYSKATRGNIPVTINATAV